MTGRIVRFLLLALAALPLGGIALAPNLVTAQEGHEGHHREQDAGSHEPSMHTGACEGFVILPNGFSVLSGLSAEAHHAHGGHEVEHPGEAKTPKGEDQLMGFRHGQSIKPKAEMLCVPVHGTEDVTWKGVSLDKSLDVTAKSLRGLLAHNSRGNEGFEINVRRDGAPVEDAEVFFVSRMPHHDRTMLGGHGLANDPDVKGLKAESVGQGRYTLQTTDFIMGGAWLFEVQVKRGAETSRAYFATEVGQE